jgi:hypothetical protein
MQIHELTQHQIDEGLGSALGGMVGKAQAGAAALKQKFSPSGDYQAAKADPVRQQQIKLLADRSYRAWKAYEKDLLRSNPDARSTGMYEQALLAFVVKNLLSGQYLPNVINQDKIKTLVKQLSGSGGIAEANVIGATRSGAPTPAEQANLQKKIAAAQAKQATQQGSPQQSAAPAVSAPAPAASAPALTPQKEKDLWLQLTQQAAVATAQAPGTSGNTPTPSKSSNSNTSSISDARTYAQQLKPTDPAVAQGLAAFGNASAKNIGNANVKSTGNPVADALLLLAGFRGI